MEIFVIDDNKEFAISLCDQLSHTYGKDCQPIIIESEVDAFIMSEIINIPVPYDSVFFINMNLVTGRYRRQNHKGVELLTWLRIKGVMNHCVLYSFQPLVELAKTNRNNLLLFSKGITFIRLPGEFSAMDLDRIKTDVAENGNLKIYLKSIFDVSKFRHRDANWWSMKVMWDVHRIAKRGQFYDDYPQHVRDNLSKLNNAVGVFLNELDVVNVSRRIEEALRPFRAKKDELDQQLLRLQSEQEISGLSIADYEDVIGIVREELESLNDAIQHLVGQAGYMDCLERRMRLQDELSFALSEVSDIETAKGDYAKVVAEIEHHENTLSNIYAKERNRLFGASAQRSVNRRIRILLIDDHAESGWETVLQKIFPSADIKSVVPQKKYVKDIDGLYRNQVKVALDELQASPDPSLVLLDLRLFDETDRSIDIEKVSGKLLLQKLRNEFRGIPVLITTASNKVWTFQKLINLGADAYWVKEGLDELRTAEDSVGNYSRLLFLVDKLTNGRYQVLKDLSSYAEKFQQEAAKHWSKNFTWDNGEQTHGDVKGICKSLNDSVLVLKNYLHSYHLGYGFQDTLNESFVLSGLINKICGVYECVHEAGKSTNYVTYDQRGDYMLDRIKELRNQVSHWQPNKKTTWDTLVEGIEATKRYLDKPPI